jgi:hypothetical protein
MDRCASLLLHICPTSFLTGPKHAPPEKLNCTATANAELGNRLIDLAAQRAAKLARDMLR